MADNTVLAAPSRTEFGKGAARRTRRAGLVPAVIYGHHMEPLHIALPAHGIQMALRTANALLHITIDGKEEHLALPKQVQRNPVSGIIEHADLVFVKKGEKVTVDVPLELKDRERSDAVVLLDFQTISLEVEATNIPTEIIVDATELEIGDSILASALVLPEGASLAGEPDALIVSVTATAAEEAAQAAEAEGETEQEAAQAAAEAEKK
ncbi:MAG: 50S ribosomal protein L25/general stress protein Ctc [Propionibacteriaceae bacterium]|jgi:large subunit ribosomal protein L25|nr:50S ribosomal protein L25/general stress protein Ctc [Propionibacteriaceae bacterium]